MLSPSNEMLCASIFTDLFLQESSFAKLSSLLAAPPQDEETPDGTALQSSGSCSLVMDIIWMSGNLSIWMCQGVKLQISGNTQSQFCSTQNIFCVSLLPGILPIACYSVMVVAELSCPFSCRHRLVLILL